MQRKSKQTALSGLLVVCAAYILVTGCSLDASRNPAPTYASVMAPPQPASPGPPFGYSDDDRFRNVASAIGTVTIQTEILTPPPGGGSCASNSGIVVRAVLNEQVLFATDSDQPMPHAPAVLDILAGSVRSNTPGAEVTVLGHTDSVGSEEYNLDLSKRRAMTVLQDLVSRGLNPERLSAVAVGKRQPIADNAMPEGRARNRRVEFLISPCLAANLEIVRSIRAAGDGPAATNTLDVLRLQQTGPGDVSLNAVAAVSLSMPYDTDAADSRAPLAAGAPHNAGALPRVSPALPAAERIVRPPTPEVKLNSPDPEPEKKELGPATSY